MSRHFSVPRSHSRTSSLSTTTYHSFQDLELFEPGSTPEAKSTSTSRLPRSSDSKATSIIERHRNSRKDDFEKQPFVARMVRQDSGYESGTPHPNPNKSSRRPARHASTQNMASTPSPRTESRTRTSTSQTRQQRPSLRRSRQISTMPRSSLTISRSPPRHPQRPQHNDHYSYFQFPSPEQLEEQQARQSLDLGPVILHVNTANQQSAQEAHEDLLPPPKEEPYHDGPDDDDDSPLAAQQQQQPPQTTHYWTSDRTRRLEYAAIDAASRGVRGWIMRNCMPECLVPREKRRVAFDDDTGSVRRYRLDLEIESPEDSVPPSPAGEKPRGFRARGRRSSFWAKFRGRD